MFYFDESVIDLEGFFKSRLPSFEDDRTRSFRCGLLFSFPIRKLLTVSFAGLTYLLASLLSIYLLLFYKFPKLMKTALSDALKWASVEPASTNRAF